MTSHLNYSISLSCLVVLSSLVGTNPLTVYLGDVYKLHFTMTFIFKLCDSREIDFQIISAFVGHYTIVFVGQLKDAVSYI